MPKIRVIAAPRKEANGFWALGKAGRYDLAGNVVEEPKSGRHFPGGEPVDIDVTDAELKELQSPPNDSFLAVMVLPDAPAPDPVPEPPAKGAKK